MHLGINRNSGTCAVTRDQELAVEESVLQQTLEEPWETECSSDSDATE